MPTIVNRVVLSIEIFPFPTAMNDLFPSSLANNIVETMLTHALLREHNRNYSLVIFTCRNREIVLLSTARMLTTFSNNQKKGRLVSSSGFAYVRIRKNSKNKRPLPSRKSNKGIVRGSRGKMYSTDVLCQRSL